MNITKILTDFFNRIRYWLWPPDFVMIGDSIIANMVATQPSLPEPFKSALNLGVHGDTSSQIRARIGTIPKGTKRVLIDGGGNNVAYPGVIAADYAAMLAAIPLTTRVIVLGIARVEDPSFNAQTVVINTQINLVAATRPNTVVASAAQNVSMVGLTIDGVHPTPAGYVVLINTLMPIL